MVPRLQGARKSATRYLTAAFLLVFLTWCYLHH